MQPQVLKTGKATKTTWKKLSKPSATKSPETWVIWAAGLKGSALGFGGKSCGSDSSVQVYV